MARAKAPAAPPAPPFGIDEQETCQIKQPGVENGGDGRASNVSDSWGKIQQQRREKENKAFPKGEQLIQQTQQEWI